MRARGASDPSQKCRRKPVHFKQSGNFMGPQLVREKLSSNIPRPLMEFRSPCAVQYLEDLLRDLPPPHRPPASLRPSLPVLKALAWLYQGPVGSCQLLPTVPGSDFIQPWEQGSHPRMEAGLGSEAQCSSPGSQTAGNVNLPHPAYPSEHGSGCLCV